MALQGQKLPGLLLQELLSQADDMGPQGTTGVWAAQGALFILSEVAGEEIRK